MTRQEARLARARHDVAAAESRVAEAQSNHDFGCSQALAIYSRECAKLQSELVRTQLDLEKERTYVTELEDNIINVEDDL